MWILAVRLPWPLFRTTYGLRYGLCIHHPIDSHKAINLLMHMCVYSSVHICILYIIFYGMFVSLQSSVVNGSQQKKVMYNVSCSQYDGVCNDYLTILTGTSNTVNTLSNDVINEEQVSELFNLLQGLPGLVSEKCSAVVMPFICQYLYPPCDSNGSPLLITQEQCVNIRDEVCTSEWRFAITTELGKLLPNCETVQSEHNFSSVGAINTSEPLNCHYQFGEYCGLCIPLCGSFSLYRVQVKFAIRGIIIFSCAVGVIVGCIVIITAVLRWKKM